MALPTHVTLVDVGPRDGLQNEKQAVDSGVKVELVHRLQAAGLKEIEVTSFVSPKWVPQMGDNAAVMAGIVRKPGVRYSVLVPNMKGLDAALSAIEQLMLRRLKASLAAPKTTISSGHSSRGAERAASSPFMFGTRTE